MIPTQGVSYPRSGRGIIHNIVSRYVGKRIKLPGKQPDPSYGEIGGEVNWAKHHDFGLGLRRKEDCQYLFQCRNPVRSIWSNFLLVRAPDKNFGAFTNSQSGLMQWKGMVKKWAKEWRRDVFVLVYEELLARPLDWLAELMYFVTDEPLKPSLLDTSFLLKPQKKLERGENFMYYDAFDTIENQCLEEMKMLNIPSWRNKNSV